MAKQVCTKVPYVGNGEGGTRGGAGSSLGTPSSGMTWLVTETPLLGGLGCRSGLGPPPRGQCTLSWGLTTALPSQEGVGVPGSPLPGWCREQNSKPRNVCISTNVLNTTFPEKLKIRVQNAAIFYFTFARSSCRQFVLRFVYPPEVHRALGGQTSAGRPGPPSPGPLCPDRGQKGRERGALCTQGSFGKDSFSFKMSSSS